MDVSIATRRASGNGASAGNGHAADTTTVPWSIKSALLNTTAVAADTSTLAVTKVDLPAVWKCPGPARADLAVDWQAGKVHFPRTNAVATALFKVSQPLISRARKGGAGKDAATASPLERAYARASESERLAWASAHAEMLQTLFDRATAPVVNGNAV
jgi:hypothetical protein